MYDCYIDHKVINICFNLKIGKINVCLSLLMKMNDFAIQILFEKVRKCVLNMGRIGMKVIE